MKEMTQGRILTWSFSTKKGAFSTLILTNFVLICFLDNAYTNGKQSSDVEFIEIEKLPKTYFFKTSLYHYLQVLVNDHAASKIRVVEMDHTVLGLRGDIHDLLLVRDVFVDAVLAFHHELSLGHPANVIRTTRRSVRQ